MKTNIIVVVLAFVISGCGTSGAKKKVQVSVVKKAGPIYETFYLPHSVELDSVNYKGKIDQEIAVQIMVNSCNEIKADFLNYMMDTYKTIEPTSSQLQPMFDAEHIGKFIVWQFANKKTDCFPQVFAALDKISTQGDEDALMLAKYGIYQRMIYESKRLNVNYNNVFNPWLKGTIKDEWFLLIDEIDT